MGPSPRRRADRDRAGWRAVAGYGANGAEAAACRRSVGVADLSFLGKLELQGEPDDVAAIVAELAGGARLAPGQAAQADGTWWCPISPDRVLAVTPPESTGTVRDALEAAADRRPGFASVLELTTTLLLERGRRAARTRDLRPGDGARPAPATLRGGGVRAGLGGADPRA